MSHQRLVELALALSAVAIATTGCGSSKTGSTATATGSSATTTKTASALPQVATTPTQIASGAPLSHSRWIAAGDAICHSSQMKVARLSFHNKAQFLNELSRASLEYAAEAEELSKIVPPKVQAGDWERLVNDVHLFGEYVTSALATARANGGVVPPAVRTKTGELQGDMAIVGKRDGFKWCSRGV